MSDEVSVPYSPSKDNRDDYDNDEGGDIPFSSNENQDREIEEDSDDDGGVPLPPTEDEDSENEDDCDSDVESPPDDEAQDPDYSPSEVDPDTDDDDDYGLRKMIATARATTASSQMESDNQSEESSNQATIPTPELSDHGDNDASHQHSGYDAASEAGTQPSIESSWEDVAESHPTLSADQLMEAWSLDDGESDISYSPSEVFLESDEELPVVSGDEDEGQDEDNDSFHTASEGEDQPGTSLDQNPYVQSWLGGHPA